MQTNSVSRKELLECFNNLQNQFDQALNNALNKDQEFEQFRTHFQQTLSTHLEDAKQKFSNNSPLSDSLNNLLHLINETNQKWDECLKNQDKGISFRKNFQDSLLVFVYGKVKSGKSSLGNYVAWGNTDPTDELKQQIPSELQPSYFSHEKSQLEGFDAEREAETRKEFRVGATEATSTIQYFKLPGLTWVDSPGLHSMNPENGELAKEYVQHADLILYTMKSDSPGRESDMNEISELFQQDKKTLLLLTGSDDVEEDWDTENDKLIQTVVMKSPERRADQRKYVQQALQAREMNTQNTEIISFSARYAQFNQDNPAAFADSGMGELFGVLTQLAKTEAIKTKQRVPMSNFRNFIQSCVNDLQPYHDLFNKFQQNIDTTKKKLSITIREVIRESETAIRSAVNQRFNNIAHLSDQQKEEGIKAAWQGLDNEYRNIIYNGLHKIATEAITDFQCSIQDAIQASSLMQLPEFKLETMQQEVVTISRGTRDKLAGIGTLVGVAAGLATGGAGLIVAPVVGGLIGGALGKDATANSRMIEVTVGDNLLDIQQQASNTYMQAMKTEMEKQTETLLTSVLDQAQQLLSNLDQEVKQFEHNLSGLLTQIESQLN